MPFQLRSTLNLSAFKLIDLSSISFKVGMKGGSMLIVSGNLMREIKSFYWLMIIFMLKIGSFETFSISSFIMKIGPSPKIFGFISILAVLDIF